MTRTLGIETSCDETSVAVVEDGRTVLVNEVASQIDVHKAFGGVVPEIASRQHTEIISQLAERALERVDGQVDEVAVTAGPGLMGSLLVGVCFGKAFAYARNLPLIGVHHIEGHLFSPLLSDPDAACPALALVVSGGHTQLIQCTAPHDYRLLGTTRDDAVGESFDKVARLLRLPYPGGPSIQRAAETGDATLIPFPRGMERSESWDFSYSGLKTAVLYERRDHPDTPIEDVAASFQAAAIDALILKTKAALAATGLPRLFVVGGVAANRHLRDRIARDIDVPAHVPPMAYCTDNAAMIAAAGHSRLRHGFRTNLDLTPNPALELV